MDVKLNEVLNKLNFENIKSEQINKVGEGAWHTVYKVGGINDQDLVIRIKKKEAYGEIQPIDEYELKTEYESTRAYYQHANNSCRDICPNYFQYFIDEDIVFTVETYMGSGKDLSLLNTFEANSYGEKLGIAFNNIHSKKISMKGFGRLDWNGEFLQGSNLKKIDEIWEEDNNYYLSALNNLINSKLIFNKDKVNKYITFLIENRRKKIQEISLVNQDITPENLILNLDKIAIIDPFPKLDFDVKYAAYFVFCYKFLLPAFSNAPRYLNNAYNEEISTLYEIADGFIQGYCYNNSHEFTIQNKRLMDEYTLWMLQEANEHVEILNKDTLNNKTIQQMGNREIINSRLDLCLEELEKLCSES
ncbi:hypothetical protein ACERII_24700 [Evansella sp. AB-rgal1]|uniref:hypothetical protein n=1 Tax=Evansella sp. AB-rgal1 TaxID=3242696 RepID=UPI00359DF91D